MSDQLIMIILLIKDHHRLKHWKIKVQSKYASIPNGDDYCLKYHNTKPQLHSVECDEHGFPHKGRGLKCKIYSDFLHYIASLHFCKS